MIYRLFYEDTYIDVKSMSMQSAVKKAIKVLGREVVFERHEEV